MLRIVEKELAGPSLKLGTIILTRDIWPFATCLKNGEILTRSSIHTPTPGLEDLEISYWDGVGEGNIIKVEISQAGREVFRDIFGMNILNQPNAGSERIQKQNTPN